METSARRGMRAASIGRLATVRSWPALTPRPSPKAISAVSPSRPARRAASAKSSWQPGKPSEPFDKQLLRNYLLTLDWNQKPPPPPLPKDLIQRTSERYLETARILTGKSPIDTGKTAESGR